LFERVRQMQKPARIDREWVSSFGLAQSQPEGVVGLLKWLRVVDANGGVDDVWTELRTSPQPTLERLVRQSYAAVFDSIDVAVADRAMVDGAFITSYQTGSTSRPVAAFFVLCELAGIEVAARSQASAPRAPSPRKEAAPRRDGQVNARRRPVSDGTVRHERDGAVIPKETGRAEVRVSINVDIPAEWTPEQVEARIHLVLASIGRPQGTAG
jgi:hypothetical protein